MKKLKLDTDALRVETFVSEAGAPEEGTIVAHVTQQNEESCTFKCQTDPDICPDTSYGCDTTIGGCSRYVVC